MTRVLIVDDEPLNLCTLEAMLAPEGYELYFADNSDAAWLEAIRLRPDIILLDVMMPGVDGYDLCRRIRAAETLREVPVLLVTALDDHRSRLKGLEAGADDFLTKPVNKEELRARLRTVASLNRFRKIADEREKARAALEAFNLRLEEQVRRRTHELEEANSLLMSYANFVSHDLRSPLAIMKGYLSLLDSGVIPVGEEAAPIVAQCFDAAKSMERLINDILQLARGDVSPGAAVQPINPRPIIDRVIQHACGYVARPPKITIGRLPLVAAHPLLIERVFHHVIGNAVKYTAHRPEPRIEIGTIDDPAGPVIFVRDNGSGFDQRQADRLFQEFSRLSTAEGTEGLGLGLSLVARLLRAHQGRIWAEGVVGEGATFHVQFATAGAMSTTAA
jgi:two-component system, sensor histidine kinase and response regulator